MVIKDMVGQRIVGKKIKIIRSKTPHLWYANKVGGVFEIIGVGQVNENPFFQVLVEWRKKNIYCEDAELVEENVFEKEEKWDRRFLDRAKQIATWSKDISSKVGCVAVGEFKQELSAGYNGFPRNIEDSSDRMNYKDVKYKFTVHAEANMICNATLNQVTLQNSTVYVYGLPPCNECSKLLIQCGISRIVFYECENSEKLKWQELGKLSESLFKESGIEVVKLKEEIQHSILNDTDFDVMAL